MLSQQDDSFKLVSVSNAVIVAPAAHAAARSSSKWRRFVLVSVQNGQRLSKLNKMTYLVSLADLLQT